jgi:hypothetical protein
MIHRANADFWNDYRALPARICARADRQFALLKSNPQHPSLQFKKLGDRKRAGNLVGAGDAEIPRLGCEIARRVPVVLDWRAQRL